MKHNLADRGFRPPRRCQAGTRRPRALRFSSKVEWNPWESCLRAADAFPAASPSAREPDLQQRAQHPARKAGPEGWGHWEAPLGARMSRKGGHAGPVWGGEELTCLESSESMRPEAQRRGPKTATRSKGVGDGFGVH